MIYTPLIALSVAGAMPKVIAVQERVGDKLTKAWTCDGKPLARTFPLGWGELEPPSKTRMVEIVVQGFLGHDEDFPVSEWSRPRGLKIFSGTSSWKDDDPKTGVWYSGLMAFPKANEASVTFHLAAGPKRTVVALTRMRLGVWQKLNDGFRARIKNRYFNDNDQPHVLHGVLSVVVPPQYSSWDVEPTVKSNGVKDWDVSTDKLARRIEFKLQDPLHSPVTLSLTARQFKPYRFEHIALHPR